MISPLDDLIVYEQVSTDERKVLLGLSTNSLKTYEYYIKYINLLKKHYGHRVFSINKSYIYASNQNYAVVPETITVDGKILQIEEISSEIRVEIFNKIFDYLEKTDGNLYLYSIYIKPIIDRSASTLTVTNHGFCMLAKDVEWSFNSI